jgi:cadmium resistance protein CadD (predicted permease)
MLLVVEFFLLFELRRVSFGQFLQRLGVIVFQRTSIFEKSFVPFAEVDTLLGVLRDIIKLILMKKTTSEMKTKSKHKPKVRRPNSG